MIQLTDGPTNHVLTNANVWSHDGKWIYYDVRSDLAGTRFDGGRIERVEVASGRVEVLYRSGNGAHVGVVTASPIDDRIVFIHGPEHPTDDWSYNATHRRGMIWSEGDRRLANLDARDLVVPFTPGALRGGSHVHVFSGDGRWISFTYEDHVLATSADPAAQKNQRGVGVSAPLRLVTVPRTHPRNHDGEFFSVLVTQTHDDPEPGSDQIGRAYEDAWVGTGGYLRDDGTRQVRALAFIGDCVADDGFVVSELFIVDIPADITAAGDAPLAGTAITRPHPPRGTSQRRLTVTTDRKFPGLAAPRHWPRSSPDGSMIAVLMKDDGGVTQLWLASPIDCKPRQLTFSDQPIASAFTFRPDGRRIACVIGDRVCEVDVVTGAIDRRTPSCVSVREEACVYSPDGRRIAFAATVQIGGHAFNQIFIAPSSLP